MDNFPVNLHAHIYWETPLLVDYERKEEYIH